MESHQRVGVGRLGALLPSLLLSFAYHGSTESLPLSAVNIFFLKFIFLMIVSWKTSENLILPYL